MELEIYLNVKKQENNNNKNTMYGFSGNGQLQVFKC